MNTTTASAQAGHDGRNAPVLELLQDAAVLRLVAAAFAYPDETRRYAVRRAFAEVTRTQGARLSRSRWSTAFRRACELYLDSGGEAEGEHVRLFFAAAAVPLHESAWGDGRRMGGRAAELADVAGFYRAFGFTLSTSRRDLPDHLCAELEFAAALLLKEAWALSAGRVEEREITRAALAEFLLAHLGRWPRALVGGLNQAQASPLYEALGLLAAEVVDCLCARLGVAPVLADGLVAAEEADCLTCPMAARGAED